MDIPFFYHHPLTQSDDLIDLAEDTARHIVSVLRMREGEALILVDGLGTLARAEIRQTAKKRCSVRIHSLELQADTRRPVTVAVSPVKNAARYEWMLEKLTEIGVRRVIPLITDRTVREKMRTDRLESIAVSAMLQSQQSWMTEVSPPCSLSSILQDNSYRRRYIAHCLPESKTELRLETRSAESTLILIGPEGDFTQGEIEASLSAGYIPVSLGEHRLRTETAAIVASVLLSI